jgi:chorismate mutase
MSSSTQRLELLRREIDVIDSAIHDLIVKRATIVEDIREIKGGAGPALRPGREAEILRRLAARHKGALPLAGVICVWREMVSAFTHLQDPFSVSVYAPPGRERLTAVARDHFGSLTQLMPVATASAAVRAVGDGTAAAAVLPLPEDGEGDAWWPLLISGDGRAPRIIARLPFLFDGKGEQALMIGAAPRDLSSGDEASLIAIALD